MSQVGTTTPGVIVFESFQRTWTSLTISTLAYMAIGMRFCEMIMSVKKLRNASSAKFCGSNELIDHTASNLSVSRSQNPLANAKAKQNATWMSKMMTI